MQQLLSPLANFHLKKWATGRSTNYTLQYHVLCIDMLTIHTVDNAGERETLSIVFIGNVKNQNDPYCNSKTRHSCATSAYVFTAPVASVQRECFCMCHSGAKSSVERERERESMLWSSVAADLLPTTRTPPLFNCQCGTFLPRPSASSWGGTFRATAIFWDKNELHRDRFKKKTQSRWHGCCK